ncbi:hypothetical protein CMK11_11140 [Candidatus Poribacteria bacterium]|nr:hypothetical protein [Candidatus Poribacteria bacterium]
MVRLGEGEYQYEVVPSWPKLPKYWELGDCTNGAVNSQGEVHITSRGAHPLTIWDVNGNFISSWGEGTFGDPHQVFIGPDDHVWITDDLEHVVTRYTPGGEATMELGTRGRPRAAFVRKPFNMPAGVGLGPGGEVFVADGYGQYLVHKFSPEGELLLTWGRQGTGPGEFDTVHNIAVDQESRVYICDRSNNRIQVFDSEGQYLTQWDIPGPNDLWIQDNIAYVAEGGQGVSLRTLDGEVIARLGGDETIFKSGHGICVDPQGSIYVTEIIRNQRVTKLQRV